MRVVPQYGLVLARVLSPGDGKGPLPAKDASGRTLRTLRGKTMGRRFLFSLTTMSFGSSHT